ncbi:hypothetical protein BC830DRAFT_1171829 [Chytriomyces sp. MP71]|nr:hypothetical protein BC830DRAFT_1171829 [Chytriomyces sp. MP71]
MKQPRLSPSAAHFPQSPSSPHHHDSFLTPASGYGTNTPNGAQQNPNWTLEEQWQWEQYQAAVQWHQWQLKQKEWQKQQREYYLAREEERKRAAAAEAASNPEPPRPTKRGTLNVPGLKPDPKPSPLRFVVSNDTESLLSRSSSFKRGSGASFMDVASPTASSARRVSFDPHGAFVGPAEAALVGSLSRSSTVRSKSVRSAGARSSIVVATSPEWSAPTDLVRVGGDGRRETISSRIEKLRDLGELPGVKAGVNDDGSVSTVLTSSTFALDGDVSVLTLTSVGEDGKPVTTQILSTAGSAGGSYDEGIGLPGPRVPSLNGSLLEGGGSMFSDPDDGLMDNEDMQEDDLQVKYNVVKAYMPAKEDELRLEVGDQVVVWQILEDGSCEGYNVGSRERGYFPVKSILG